MVAEFTRWRIGQMAYIGKSGTYVRYPGRCDRVPLFRKHQIPPTNAVSRVKQIVFILLLFVVLVMNLVDFSQDLVRGASMWHLIEEASVIALTVFAMTYLGLHLRRRSLEFKSLRQEIAQSHARLALANARMKEARHQYSQVIRSQFEDWRLTPSEQEVALLLLKGLSLREIAEVRESRGKTVRQHASAVYKKSGLNGRHGFAAWFFEDFLG